MSRIANSMPEITPQENKRLSRSHSFTGRGNLSIKNEAENIENSPLKRSKAISNLASSTTDGKSNNLAKIDYKKCKVEDINSRDYLSCNSIATLPINSVGISLDKNGHLVLIKGKSYDLLKGMFIKYTKGYEYETSTLVNEGCDKKFESLYIDNNGLLIGVEKETGRNYVIKISNPELDANDDGQLVTLDYLDYSQTKKMKILHSKLRKISTPHILHRTTSYT